ncbi:MAG: hypothetical protein UU73_C0007G0023 [Candidatus Daviesbacteria bacterium GW2011_GWA1_41_61]|uniref:Uncharacterized protein n=1 Tax=Candidatus Daviesbacteria bacterium GW2011_GWA2_40_9 TaxID=1618424 RepID=A0A0G0TZV6_9BACT|nr:MAG: hypothetical protein UU26_C0014G0013 [Candidatus Daviesbacteria bacterium GW2011_GWC1_40_9]KKR82373.1 MAG: hypothetical protein UU29_C0014G0006 [Candidatus Daviesbacteria bacterium GW2011_GWA2_40_9]KKR92757.1 MAG: hypothetical protein UU44_C0005G0087 [Candidatus Daviesbacteria bacterium GW2011_GWB1_41_15]KKS14516.1 MAG: hypothetical protein UU73_C0007G0023 [Candidatus Daviesbacteria bacterium GW2011_GWA1_41_61]
MEQQLLNLILTSTFTRVQALRRLRTLREVVIRKFFSQANTPSLKEASGEEAGWISSLPADFFKGFNDKNIYQLFNTIEEEIKNIRPLTIFVPVDLPQEETEKLGKHLRSAYGEKFMMDLKIDPSLIAGARLIWNGLARDYSLRQRITDNQQTILAALKQYIKH